MFYLADLCKVDFCFSIMMLANEEL